MIVPVSPKPFPTEPYSSAAVVHSARIVSENGDAIAIAEHLPGAGWTLERFLVNSNHQPGTLEGVAASLRRLNEERPNGEPA